MLRSLTGVVFGAAASTASDDMSGAGAGVVARIGLGSGCQGLGMPYRLLVTTTGVSIFGSVTSAANSSATSTEPTTAK